MAISLNHTVCNLVRYFFLFYSWEWQWKIISSENNILYKSTVQCTMMDLLICWKGPKKLPLTFNCKLISFLQSSNALILLNFSTKLQLNMVFFCQNCSDSLWEKIVLVMEKKIWNLRLKAKNLQNFWDH